MDNPQRRTDCLHQRCSVLFEERRLFLEEYERCTKQLIIPRYSTDTPSTDYGGISASRLEILEDRLRDDVLAEVHAFGGRCVYLFESNLIMYTDLEIKPPVAHRDC